MGNKVILLFWMWCWVMTLEAQDLGTQDIGCYGETFAISEKNLLTAIIEKLQAIQQSGKLALHQHIIQERMAKQALQPEPVKVVRHTSEPRTLIFDPTFVVDRDIHDHNGRVLYTKGTRFNPLHQVSLTNPLLFIDGDVHLDWVKEQLHQQPNAKVILVKGNPQGCEELLMHPVYFDQGGLLCQRLRLTQVPARVTQEGNHLLINEVTP